MISVDKEQGNPIDHEQDANSPLGNIPDKTGQALDAVIDVLEDIQTFAAKGRPKAIRIRFGDKTVAELPIGTTAAAALGAGLAAVLLAKLAVEIVHEER